MSAPTGTRIVVVGSINADLFSRVERHPRPGETLHGTGGEVMPGGKGANQAVSAALLGGDVAMVGAIGDDAHAREAISRLRASGADLSAVRTVPGPTGLAIVTVARDGENTIIVVPGANGTMDAAAVQECADLIGVAGAVVLQGEIPRSGIEAAARLARGRVLLNPSPVLELDPEVIRGADPLLVNEHEAAQVLALLGAADAASSRAVAEADETPEQTDPRALITALRDQGVRSVVLTLGAKGALVADGRGREVEEIPAVRVSAVDTTGAGDAFTGAIAVKLMEGSSLAEAARFAARVSAFAVQRPGAQPSYPSTADELPR